MSLDYLGIARQGKNQWWRYVLGIFLSLFFWMFIGGVASITMVFFLTGDLETESVMTFIKSRSTEVFVVNNILFVFWFWGTVLAVRGIHGRSAWGLVGADQRINWWRFSYGFVVWFIISIIPPFIALWMSPGEYKFDFDINKWPFAFLMVMIFTPIQTSAEEIFFRGYLLQGIGLITRQPLVLIFSNGLLFMLPHLGNPEIANGFFWVALQYFTIGVFLAFITLQDNRLELALGLHAANNITHIFFTTSDSALGTPALWTARPTPAGFMDIVLVLISISIAYYLFFYKRLWS
jgi:uncharacterized protein